MIKRRRRTTIKAEVNLTPLIDVMTCLLAIFMITAPMLTTGIPLSLPKGDGKSIESAEKTLDIGIDKTGAVFVGEEKVPRDKLVAKIEAIVKQNPKIQMVLSADSATSYGQVIETMALLRVAGFTQVALKTDAKVMQLPDKKRK
jgi:biopolymer transport protein TolR